MEKAQLSQDISNVFDEVIDILNAIPQDLFNKVPFEDSWTIGQVAEHIAICSRGIPDSHVKEAERPYDENEEALKSIFLDMNQKAKADPAVTPHLPPHQKENLVEKIKANKILLANTIKDKELLQLCLDMEFPFMGYLTRYEWLRFVQVHTQRHLNQIKNIQAHLLN
ncbi:DinB family protein [Niabella yanshanensis]|uniref:DinB family protein n=1 Tax=Niabella yanshanensis TaxID=577386 RepID=A0ABZ0WCY6_9BACT|nr:DinB family protein [Niabella yanshanensis]WQD40545.1 DinB family protein [Niabella yanshanensis]